MGVKRYLSVGGQLLGEYQVDTDEYIGYMSDALGNVSSTVGSGGDKVNEYLYSPFGEMVKKTGTSPDPKYLWCGTWGYRASGNKWVSHYVRARHYSFADAAWTSVDPLWPSEMAYGYVEGRVMTGVDYWGMQPRQVAPPGYYWDCYPGYDDRCTLRKKPGYGSNSTRRTRGVPLGHWMPPFNPSEDDNLLPPGVLPRPTTPCGDELLLPCMICLSYKNIQEDSNLSTDKLTHFMAGCLARIRCGGICPDNVGSYKELNDQIFGGTVSRADAVATDDGWDFASSWDKKWGFSDIDYCKLGAYYSRWSKYKPEDRPRPRPTPNTQHGRPMGTPSVEPNNTQGQPGGVIIEPGGRIIRI